MDPKKAYGVELALGKALAGTDGADVALRGFATKAAFEAWLAGRALGVPAPLVAEYLADVTEEGWPRTRAKLLLAVKLGRGDIERAKGHEAGRGVRR